MLALSAACLALALAACGGSGAKSAGPVPSVPVETGPPPPSPGWTTEGSSGTEPPAVGGWPDGDTVNVTFEVWFVRDLGLNNGLLTLTSRTAAIPIGYGQDHWISRQATAAVETLLAGPTSDEAAADLGNAIPPDTRLLGSVTHKNGIATVNLSSEFGGPGGGDYVMLLRLAQIVFTVTQFPSIESVQFEFDGQPIEVQDENWVNARLVTREDYERVRHPPPTGDHVITVEAPTIGSEVASPVRIAGTANFEGNVRARVLDAARHELAEDFATTTWVQNDYEIEIPFAVSEPQRGVIQVDDANGIIVEIPVALVP